MADLDGPRLEPRSGKAKQLVVFLHGYGADGNDLIDIGRAWQSLLPDAAFVSPHAPRPCGQAPTGREWFPLTFRDPNERWVGVKRRRRCSKRFSTPNSRGANCRRRRWRWSAFRQGTMMALHVGLRRAVAAEGHRRLFRHAGGAGGRRPGSICRRDQIAAAGAAGAWRQDQLIPVQALMHAAQGLAALEVPVEWHISPGIGHGIDPEGLRHGGEFLAKAFRAALLAIAGNSPQLLHNLVTLPYY